MGPGSPERRRGLGGVGEFRAFGARLARDSTGWVLELQGLWGLKRDPGAVCGD